MLWTPTTPCCAPQISQRGACVSISPIGEYCLEVFSGYVGRATIATALLLRRVGQRRRGVVGSSPRRRRGLCGLSVPRQIDTTNLDSYSFERIHAKRDAKCDVATAVAPHV